MVNDEIKEQFLIELGAQIKKFRIDKNMSQEDLAAKINRDVEKIKKIERGLYDIKLSSILIIAEALETNVLDLLKINNLNFFQKFIWKK